MLQKVDVICLSGVTEGERGLSVRCYRRWTWSVCPVLQKVDVVSFTDQEYQRHLQADGWSKAETEHLFDLCRRFDLRSGLLPPL